MEKELHIITNGQLKLAEVISIAQKITPFITAIHIREKDRSQEEIEHWIQQLLYQGIPRKKLILNSHVQIAGKYNLTGVQLPTNHKNPFHIKKAFPFLRIGVSVHSLSEALFYQKNGADFLLFGNVYETMCKPGLKGKGISQLEDIVQAISIPVMALGGVQPEHVPELNKVKASGIAVMSGVMEAQDPLEAVRAYQDKLTGRSKRDEIKTI